MKNKWLILAGAVALTAFSTAQAIPITGQIAMSGSAMLDNTQLGLSTQASVFSNVRVGGLPSGSFTGTFNDVVTWSAFTWVPAGSATPLWTFSDAGTGYTYTFNLASDTIIQRDNSFLNLLGTGTLFITGSGSPYDVGGTAGTWSFNISDTSGGSGANFVFTFANSQTAVVPDGGATVMLLGAALSALGLFRKKLIA
jgi:hypothetical protein